MDSPDLHSVRADQHEELEEPVAGDGDPQSILAQVRAEWDRETVERTFDLALPGSQGRYLLRFGPIRGTVLTKLRQRLETSRSPERDTNLNADVLIAACRGMYARPAPSEEPILIEDEDGPLTRIDDRLGRALGMPDATTARQVVFRLYRHANVPDLAIAAAAGQYMEWASGADEDIGEELLGES